MPSKATYFLVMVSALFFGMISSSVQAQNSDEKMDEKTQNEVRHLRAIARTIKECPRVADFKDTGGGTIYNGPPSNVVWDVKPSGSVRAPYLGFVEFFLPREFSASERVCAKNPRYCAEITNATKPYRYRFEFDLGPDGLESTRLLVKSESDKEWTDARPDDSCWQKATHLGEKKSE